MSAKERHQQTSNLWLLIDSNGRTIWIADAHRDDGKRYVVRAEEKLTGFLNWNRRSGSDRRTPRNLRFNDSSVSGKK
jgi:hypothetical protein